MKITKVQVVRTWTFRSGSSTSVYEVIMYSDGSLSCDCKGWTIKRQDRERTCKHVREVQRIVNGATAATIADPMPALTRAERAAGGRPATLRRNPTRARVAFDEEV
jgi:hypothetical protein